MRLTGIDCQIPSNQIFNEDIIELVKFNSAALPKKTLIEIETTIRKFLTVTGIESRYWRTKKERPIDLIKLAVDNALLMSNIALNDVDLVIYSSIDRGFIEPANAAYICKFIGLDNVRNFDIVDACMGWASAVQVAQSFLTTSPRVNSVLIINSEFPMNENGQVLPENFTIRGPEELRWKVASYTLGEAASACIFQKDNSVKCGFEFIENSFNSDLCTILGDASGKYYGDSESQRPYMQFYADSASLYRNGIQPAVQVLNNLLGSLNYIPKYIFPHSVSDKVIGSASSNAGIKPLIYSTFSKLGNLATASIPASIKKAFLNDLIVKNDKCVGWVASAGMKFSAFEIIF